MCIFSYGLIATLFARIFFVDLRMWQTASTTSANPQVTVGCLRRKSCTWRYLADTLSAGFYAWTTPFWKHQLSFFDVDHCFKSFRCIRVSGVSGVSPKFESRRLTVSRVSGVSGVSGVSSGDVNYSTVGFLLRR